MTSQEVNFDGLVGPTHNYSGLSYGNIASMEHGKLISNPKEAALQGLEKMRMLMSLGIPQAIIPPHERPFIPVLRSLGYNGPEDHILEHVWKIDPKLLLASCSAASMWTANAATVSPSVDSKDNRVHITPANLISKFHRSFEPPITAFLLRKIFANPHHFVHHYPLPCHADYADEGAANHTRFCRNFGEPGVQLFVYGRKVDQTVNLPTRFPARQTDAASKALARIHHITSEQAVFAQQSPEAIDGGVFHNDVISVGHQNVFLYHEKAFVNTPQVIDELKRKVENVCQTPLHLFPVPITLEEAVRTYLFNSQLVTLPDQTMVLISPTECRESPTVKNFIDDLLSRNDHPIKKVIYHDVRQSMQNGGGPACLRLRVVLNEQEMAAAFPSVFLTDALYNRLKQWINKFYRDQLRTIDLIDPLFLNESRRALDDLTAILNTGPLYPFQIQRLHQRG